MAVDTLIHFTQDEIEYARQTSLLKGELDWRTGMREAEHRGLSKGRNEASLDIARKMKAMDFLAEQIHTITGLSTETIAQL
jgi:predicted transposase/invertase (TIGR01784 family)